jgi:hypothetical protein
MIVADLLDMSSGRTSCLGNAALGNAAQITGKDIFVIRQLSRDRNCSGARSVFTSSR